MTPTPAPEPRSLTAIATEILSAHRACLATAASALEFAKQAGELLSEAKAQLQHGEWLPWLESHCPNISVRVAQGYMRIAREWPRLLEAVAKNEAAVSYLPIRDAFTILADEWNDPDELGAGGSNDQDDDDDNVEDDDNTDRYLRTLQIRLTVKKLAELRQWLNCLKPLLRTTTDADTVWEGIRQLYTAISTSHENSTKDDDANDPAYEQRPESER